MQPMASRAWSSTMAAITEKAVILVSSRTAGQKVMTNTEPEINMAIRIKSHCSHSYETVHNILKQDKWGNGSGTGSTASHFIMFTKK